MPECVFHTGTIAVCRPEFQIHLSPIPHPRYPKAVEISKTVEKGASVLELKGEIDLHGSPQLRSELHALVEKKTPALVADFTGVQYIDSSGLATLVEYVRDSKPFGGKIALFGLQPKVKMVFELVRLNELFTIADSKESALAAVAAA
ncbi:MAG: STAS domain-containing protein [Chthoniobacterales bacterium]